jgi:hypothetical protein
MLPGLLKDGAGTVEFHVTSPDSVLVTPEPEYACTAKKYVPAESCVLMTADVDAPTST